MPQSFTVRPCRALRPRYRVGSGFSRVPSVLLASAWLLLGSAGPSMAASAAGLSPGELKRLSFEELLDLRVTLVSKRPEKLSQAASAIQVITAEDIRRSGATHLAEVLRLAFNVEVQQINSYAWVVSTRGFDALFSNKLLVMIDGRTVYTPLDAGVFWDAQNVLLEDVDRIEVISGPGAALWGSNAVNGVINIVTKPAQETRGVHLAGAGGSFLRDAGALRVGGSLGTRVSYRIYGQQQDRNSTRLPNGDVGSSSWRMRHGGFRVDADLSESSTMTVQGDAYAGTEYNSPLGRSSLDGQDLLAHWRRAPRAGSALDVQLYVDRTWRRDLPSTVRDQLTTYDVEVQHLFSIAGRHDVLWGGGYRLMEDHAETSTPFVGFVPAHRTLRLVTGFVQDEIAVVPGRLKLTLGSRFEHHYYVGGQAQPSARLAWTGDSQTLWAAVSRALRSPSRIDVDYHIPKTPPYAIAGGPDFHSESLVAYEIGYRVQPLRVLSLALATSYNHYDDLYSVELANPPAPLPYTIQNGAAGQSWGIELSGLYQPFDGWRLRGGYTRFEKDLWSRPGHNVLNNVLASLGNDPLNQAVIQSIASLGEHVQWDVTGRYVDMLPNPRVESYFAIDARLAMQSGPWEIALVGQNLNEPSHAEYYKAQEIPRSVYGQITGRW